jgi:hypothetical protein
VPQKAEHLPSKHKALSSKQNKKHEPIFERRISPSCKMLGVEEEERTRGISPRGQKLRHKEMTKVADGEGGKMGGGPEEKSARNVLYFHKTLHLDVELLQGRGHICSI